MTYGEFLNDFDDVMQAFGKDHFPRPILDRAYAKLRDLERAHLREVCNLIIDNCEYAPKIPKINEFASLVRSKHRGFSQPVDERPDPRGNPEMAAKVRNLIKAAFGNKEGA